MRKHPSSIAIFSTLVVGVALACSSSNRESMVDATPQSGAGAPSGSAGAPASAGALPTSSTSGRGSTAGATGNSGTGSTGIPSEACKGLPFELAGDAAGAPATEGEGGAPDTASGEGSTSVACNGVSVEAEAVPVDVFVIMDRSQSMGTLVEGSNRTRWQALHDAVQRFTQSPSAADIRAGIGFFSLSGVAHDAEDCDPDAYAEPRVPIGRLSEVGPDLVAAMDSVSPGGLTPTVPALRGALSYARTWARNNPGRATMVVLVTDGFPTQCDNAPDQITEAARAGYESAEHIRTFVIGVGDVARFNLDNYARAGGTRRAYLTDAGDVTSTFVDALNNITNRALACEYQLPAPPEGMKLDTEKVQVVYTPASGAAEEVPSVSSFNSCATTSNGGWYYDDPRQPSKITVCPCTCSRLQAGRVDVRLGCKPRLGLR